MAETNLQHAKRPYNELSLSLGFKHVRVSMCNKTANKRHIELNKAIEECSASTRETLVALSSLLDELVVVSCMSFDQAFEQFAGMIPNVACKQDKKESRRLFKDKILSKNGIPVLFLENAGHTFIMLLDLPLDNITCCHSLELVLAAASKQDHSGAIFPTELASCIPMVMKLMSTSKDRAILVFVLSSICSSTKLALTLGMQHQRSQKIKQKVDGFLNEVSKKEEETDVEAQSVMENIISRLQVELEKDINDLNMKRARLHDEEVESRNFDIEMKEERLGRLRGRSKHEAKKRISRRLFYKWKQNLMTQKGKGKGRYRIDRGAEHAIYEVLQEQLKAHRRRWGDEGTGYLEHEQRIQSKEMQRIANKFLRQHGKKPIKSKETARSWGKCKNKRYRQAKQHRGRNLWAHLRAQKKHQDRHLNTHYNRAHVKN